MTLDAMHWVWTQSQAKGNARIALLWVADQVRTQACEVRLSYPSFMGALGTDSRGAVKNALEAAQKTGELEVKEPAAGRRAPLYRLPKAVGYVRPARSCGPENGTQDQDEAESCGPENGPQREPCGPGNGTQPDDLTVACGPKNGTQDEACGPENGPPLPTTPSQPERAGQSAGSSRYPADVLPLVHTMSASGLNVRWPWEGNGWFPIIAIIRDSGIDAMVEYALRAAANARSPVTSAKYFLPGWRELPPKPPEGTPARRPTPHLRAVGSYQSPEDRGIF